MRQLLKKDFTLHRKPFLLLTGGLVVLVTLARLWPRQSGVAANSDNGQYGLFQLHMSLVLFAGVLMSEWLVVQERAQRTVMWLRTLPLSDHQIVGSKFLAYLLMQWALILISLAVVGHNWILRYSTELLRDGALTQVLVGMVLGCRFVFSPKLGLIVPMLAGFTVTTIYALLGPNWAPAHLIVDVFWNVPGVLIASVGAFFLTFLITARIVAQRETTSWA